MARFSVLIVDDSDAVSRKIAHTLETGEVADDFHFAADGLSGYRVLLEQSIDLVLCDLVMPDIDGFKFLSLKNEREELVEIPVIMLTGAASDLRSKVKCFEAGASDYVTKPFEPEELIARVRVHLKLKALQDELRAKNRQLLELATTDELTQLTNRRHFLKRLDTELNRAGRQGTSLAFLMFDVDRFKALNDAHGHLAGDEALRRVSRALADGLREYDLVGRYGGEELCMMVPGLSAEDAFAIADRHRQAIEELRFEVDGIAVPLTVSVGVALFDGKSPIAADALIGRADEALYRAKRSGRNRVELSALD